MQAMMRCLLAFVLLCVAAVLAFDLAIDDALALGDAETGGCPASVYVIDCSESHLGEQTRVR